MEYVISQIDDGDDWWHLPDQLTTQKFASEELAVAAAKEFIFSELPSCNYGQDDGCTSVDLRIRIAEAADLDCYSDFRSTYSLLPDESELVAAAGGDPNCCHEWVESAQTHDVGCGFFRYEHQCKHCSVIKIERVFVYGDKNPGDSDTVEYVMPKNK